MVDRIILISGPVSSGKTELARRLAARFDAPVIRTRDLIVETLSDRHKTDRAGLQRAGDRLDRETNGQWLAVALARLIYGAHSDRSCLIVDSVRIEAQSDRIRESFGPNVTHIHVTAPLDVLKGRFNKRAQDAGDAQSLTYDDVRRNRTERRIDRLSEIADVVIDTDRCTPDDVVTRAEAALRRRARLTTGYVDVLVGGQYGSEGKGQITSFISREYDLLVRVGGPNAGHKVFEEPEPFTHHQLPSGTRKSSAQLLIGPGAVLNTDKLLGEIAACEVDADRLGIDGKAMVIEPADIENEEALAMGIGSTKQGVGFATARRITNRELGLKLARDVTALQPFICDAVQRIADAVENGGRVLLEGTQGTGLSLYHGSYPYVTSRDTTVAACLSEAGIPPAYLRRVVMVCRTYPIRVESPKDSTSGPMSIEIDWGIIAERSGISETMIREAERTSTTDRMRRVGEFDWALLRKAAQLNRPTDIALTFVDYLNHSNGDAKRFEQLTPETIRFVEEVESVCEAPVSLISTGFNNRSVIDRRRW